MMQTRKRAKLKSMLPLRVKNMFSHVPLPTLNFIHIHYIYFLTTSLIAGTIFWGSSTPDCNVAYVDSLFFTVSAMTEAGLNTVNLSQLNTFQQAMLFVLIMLGSSIWVSAWVVGFRRRAFQGRYQPHKKLKLWDIAEGMQAEAESSALEKRSSVSLKRAGKMQSNGDDNDDDAHANAFADGTRQQTLATSTTNVKEDDVASVSGPGRAYVTRNSNFVNLDAVERERVCEIEYKAVVFLSWVVPIYFVLGQLLGSLSMGAYTSWHFSSVTHENGLNPWWVGAFNCVSAFNNSGMSLLDANLIPFSDAPFVLLSMASFILAGNTCYPIILRLFIWILRKCLPDNKTWADSRHTLKFLLDHPRRCYTNLFPSQHTWWLLGAVLVLNGIDSIMYIVLNIGNEAITHDSPTIEFVDAVFQATAVRNGGFYVVPISNLRIGLQVLYAIMMYISAYPIAITIRNSNVYEERSLGIYSDDPYYQTWEEDEERKRGRKTSKHFFNRIRLMMGQSPPGQSSRWYFMQQQFRAQLAHDLWWLVLAVWLIVIIETEQFDVDPVDFSVFNVIFEVVSAYGTVGISVGIPGQAYSFCGAWHALSKLILCAVMLRGRHRGLPVAIDKAILLPTDHKNDMEAEDERIREGHALGAGELPPGLA